MKQINLVLACLLLLGLSGLCLYIILWDPVGIQQFVGFLLNLCSLFWGKVLLIALAFISLSCGLSLLAQLMGLDTNYRPNILLQQEQGVVSVSIDAIEDFVRRKAQLIDGVRDLYVQADLSNEGLSVQTKVTLELQRNIPEFIKTFQGKIHYELSEVLGIQKIKDIQILIHKILPKEGGLENRLLGSSAPVLLKEPEGDMESLGEAIQEPVSLTENPKSEEGKPSISPELGNTNPSNEENHEHHTR